MNARMVLIYLHLSVIEHVQSRQSIHLLVIFQRVDETRLLVLIHVYKKPLHDSMLDGASVESEYNFTALTAQ